ncbi:Protein kinase alk2 [Phlyctochytrium planicorne]|nr:Protein kinase alk2 [Phlyctochytrium planicorne]
MVLSEGFSSLLSTASNAISNASEAIIPADSTAEAIVQSIKETAINSNSLIAAAAVISSSALIYLCWDAPILAKAVPEKNGGKGKGVRPQRAPNYIPILGHTFECVKHMNDMNDYFHDCFKVTNNQPVMVQLPRQPTYIVVNDPESVEHVLKTKFEIYDKGKYLHDRIHDVLGTGIFNADGESWWKQRKTAANIFNVKNFKEFVGVVFREEMDVFVDRLSQAATKLDASSNVVDLQDLFFRFTLDGFAKIGYGIDLNTLSNSSAKIPFAVNFDESQAHMEKRFLNPFWDVEEAITPAGGIQRAKVKIIREFGEGIVRDRRREIEENPEEVKKKNDLLTLFMKEGEELSNDTLVDYVLNFIIAGRDTTAQALSWTFFMLAHHPSVLATLRAEIDQVLGPYDPNSTSRRDSPTYDEVKKEMPYANAVFHETLRLFPSVPKEMKQANRDDVLPDGTAVKEGTMLLWSPYAMGRSEAIWGPTASRYDPSRFLSQKQPSPFSYPVFNAGPRVCLGKNLAELEGVFVLTSVARLFDFELVDERDLKDGAKFKASEGDVNVFRGRYGNSLTLPMKDGLKVRVSERKA